MASNPHRGGPGGSLYGGAAPYRSKDGLSTRTATGSEEIQLRIDPMHSDLDDEITGLHGQIAQEIGSEAKFQRDFLDELVWSELGWVGVGIFSLGSFFLLAGILGIEEVVMVNPILGLSVAFDLSSGTSGGLDSQKRRGLVVRAGKAALCQTKRSRSRKSLARTHGFRLRMRTTSGRATIKRRRAKGRWNLCPKSNPSSGKRA
ncbi:hypothetical protein F2Q70_00012667 [Brassica cretica]|uniref:Large ribosomal subunit protein bL34c n=1 Tax=Brassica cretica TaxID=69181 RepID=A0A8S9LW45_BRACR|nr:hypothetical protein F2Q70_00012667 [Brassica cretica]